MSFQLAPAPEERLEHLGAHGPSPYAFTARKRFAPPTLGEKLLAEVDG